MWDIRALRDSEASTPSPKRKKHDVAPSTILFLCILHLTCNHLDFTTRVFGIVFSGQ